MIFDDRDNDPLEENLPKRTRTIFDVFLGMIVVVLIVGLAAKYVF